MAHKYGNITKEILFYLALGGAIVLAATSPYTANNILRYFQGKGHFKRLKEKLKFSQALSRMKSSRLIITKQNQNGNFLVELTEKGKHKVKELQFENLTIPRQEKWDTIWRIVLFDIPKKKNRARDALRQKLRSLGFIQFQESAWVYPYPCNQEIEFIVEFFEVYPYVQIIEARKVQNDLTLRKHFGLL
jgi:DNA-binding transcriptional regulator PaaX